MSLTLRRIEWEPEAEHEAEHALAWYFDQSLQIGEAFQAALVASLSEVHEAPHRWPLWRPPDLRRYVLQRFPYLLFYRAIGSDRLLVIALLHQHRDLARRLP